MKIFDKTYTWTSAGCVMAIVAGAPAWADDTELLLFSPNAAQNPKPNVMFILDSSGSMDEEQETTKPYDSNITYSGTCDTDVMYWSDVDLLPSCDPSNEQWINKSAFECEFAERQIDGIGAFTNTMVQFRDADPGNGDDDDKRWDYLDPGNHDDYVECLADSGTHGSDDEDEDEVYAASGTGEDPWTDEEDEEIAWGSAPRNLSYTVYDGNYLNWKANPETVTMERTDIMKAVTKTVLSSVNNMNVGIMRFNNKQGGSILTGVTDLDSNRTEILNTIQALPADGYTPLSETLFESAHYWLGRGVDFGDSAITDTDALVGGVVANGYDQPALASCAKNYNVMVSDGLPTEDDDGPTKAPTLPDWNTVLGRSGCTGSGQGHCLDDIAEYLGKVDSADNLDGTQTVTTHTIGFTQNIPILEDTAQAAGGKYFRADNVEELTVALLQILGEINDRSLSFSAPAVSVNTFNRTRNLNSIYLTMFGARNQTHWPGNLKKYGIDDNEIVDADGLDAVDPTTGFFYDTARSIWTVGGDDGQDVRLGGAARKLPNPSNRNLFTNNGTDDTLSGPSNALTTGNSAAYTLADFGLTGGDGEPSIDEMIDWMRGVDVRDEDGNPATSIRYAMGDPLHSRPAAVVYGGTEANPDTVAFVATNDGYIHAVDGETGVELWSFVPKELLPNMARLYFNPGAKYKQYGVDGDVIAVTKDVDRDGVIESSDGDFVRIVVGMRRGGTTYYGLDVTTKTAPKLMWTKTVASAGQSWSSPVISRVDANLATQNADKGVVIVGGGYDPVHDTAVHPSSPDAAGAGIHIFDLATGADIWRAGPDTDTGADERFTDMTRAFPTQIRVLDINGDNFVDRMYAADISGQIWRFDVRNGQSPADLVEGGVIARLGAEGLESPTAGDTRRFYNTPDISIFRDPIQGRRYMSIAIGSGYRASPFDTTAVDRFYSLRDPAVFAQLDGSAYSTYDVITEDELVEVSGTVQNVVGPNDRGWKFTLPADEKIVAGSLTFNNEIFFVSLDPNTASATICGAGQGTNYLYRVSVVNGDPIVQNLDAITPGLEDEARREKLPQGGIAPSPAVIFPSPAAGCTGGACNPPPLICIGAYCREPGDARPPVRTLWTEDGIE